MLYLRNFAQRLSERYKSLGNKKIPLCGWGSRIVSKSLVNDCRKNV